VAISIPIFTSQLEKARDGVSIANIRAAYAQAQSAYLTADGKTTDADTDVTVEYGKDGKVATITVANVVIKSQKANNWSGVGAQLPWVTSADAVTPNDDGTATTKKAKFTYDGTGKITSVTLES
jgi:uncharacterized protein YuzE